MTKYDKETTQTIETSYNSKSSYLGPKKILYRTHNLYKT